MVAGDETELLRHPEHPLCPGKGELGQAVPPCHTSLGLGTTSLSPGVVLLQIAHLLEV